MARTEAHVDRTLTRAHAQAWHQTCTSAYKQAGQSASAAGMTRLHQEAWNGEL